MDFQDLKRAGIFTIGKVIERTSRMARSSGAWPISGGRVFRDVPLLIWKSLLAGAFHQDLLVCLFVWGCRRCMDSLSCAVIPSIFAGLFVRVWCLGHIAKKCLVPFVFAVGWKVLGAPQQRCWQVLLWDTDYFERLWCTYEVWSRSWPLLSAHKDGCKTWLPFSL